MRTRLRSKFTLFFIVCAALLAVGGTAMALVTDTSGNTAPAPTIQSDQADYPPGGLVTLTGSGWQPGELVNIVVNDDAGQTWNRNVNVTADASGNISDSFNLPDWFVATYSVKATGASGAVATTTFTDGQVKVEAVGTAGASAPISWVRYSNTTCTPGTPVPPSTNDPNVVDSGSFSASTTGNGTTIQTGPGNTGPNMNLDNSQSLKLTAGSVSGFAFSSWSPTADFTTTGSFTSTSNPGCLKGANGALNTDVTYVADTTAPTVTVVSASPATVGASGSSTITWKANENGSFSVRVGGTSCSTGTQVASGNYTTQPNNTTSTVNASDLSEGANTIRVCVTDSALNTGSATTTVTKDTIKPTLTVSHTGANANGWNKTSPVTLNVSASDNTDGSGLAGAPDCKDGTTSLTLTAGTAGNWTASVSGEGTHNITCSVSDNAGNSNSANDTVKIDTTQPTLTVSHTGANANGWNKTSPVTLNVSASDNTDGSGLAGAPDCKDGTTSLTLTAGTAGNWTASVSGEGTHNITCSVKDNADNTKSANDTVKIDTQAVPSQASANRYSNSSPITVNYTTTNAASDTSGLVKVELWAKGPQDADFSKVDEKTTASGSFSYTVNQGDGDYRFYTIAEDNAGNREVQPPSADAIVTVTHDTQAPTLTVGHTADGNNGWNKTSPVILNVSASDSGSDLTGAPACKDGTTSLTLTAGTAGNWTASVSGDGTHNITCSVSDNAGNPSGEKTDTIKIDTVNPTATFQGIASTTYPVANVPAQSAISCSATDVTSPPATCVVDFTGYSNAFGSHTLTATATDQAGNTNTATLTYIVGLQAGEVLSPINSIGKANPAAPNLDSFKIKSTVPVKFQLFNDTNKTQLMTSPPAGSVAKLTFFKQDNDTTTSDLTDTLTGLTPNTDNIFRWSATDSQYVYNLGTSTKNTAGTYGVQLTLYASNGTTVLAQSAKYYFVLRS